ncbi:MAG: hypothetical protein ABI806_03265 [Candidatus Solibacter sp.]
MTRSLAYFLVPFSFCLALARPAAGQAGVEAGLGAARAVTTTAPARGIGKSLSGLSGSLEKTIKSGHQSSPLQTVFAAPEPAAKAPSTPAAPPPTWEDAVAIESGLAYDDLVRRFGPPTMSISNTTGKSLTYRGKDGWFQVEVLDGAVATVARP